MSTEVTTNKQEYLGWRIWQPSMEELSTFWVTHEANIPDVKENEYVLLQDSDGTINKIYKFREGHLEEIDNSSIVIKNGQDGRKRDVFVPRNPQQRCAFDLIHDTKTTVKLITGRWGTGKTLILVVGALEALWKGRFSKIVWIRNNVEVKDTEKLGALPGDVYEKLLPYLGPFIDHAGGKKAVENMVKSGQLEVEPLQSLRGRDIKDAIIMCSESENLSKEHLQLILARAAEGSIVLLDGDTKQRDKTSFEKSRGIETLIERLAGDELFGYVRLTKSERSKTAMLADKLD